MSREIIIKSWCDNEDAHPTERAESDGALLFAVNGKPPRELDLCDKCTAALYEPLGALLDNHGRAPSEVYQERVNPRSARLEHPELSRPTQGTPWQCPECGADMKLGSALGHLWSHHLRGVERPKQPETCPDCGYYSPAKEGVGHASSMGMHRSTRHGWDPRSEALAIIAARKVKAS